MIRRLAVLAWVACAPALAAAQGITVSESTGSGTVYITSAECQSGTDILSFQWSVSSTSGAFNLYASDTQGCPTTAPAGQTITFHTAVIAPNVTTTFVTNITAGTVLNAAQIGCTTATQAVFVCVFDASSTASPLASVSIPLDLVPPAAPQAVSISAGDSSLNVTWQLGTATADAGTPGSAYSFRVYYQPSDGSSPVKYSSFSGAGTTSGRVSGLTNGVPYTLYVTALTIGGNESGPSNTLTGSPIVVNDFWRLYEGAGGKEQGGCATGAAGLAALAALAPLAWRKRRSRS